jgi:hypothetical protein
MNSETSRPRAVLGRMLLAGVFAVAAGTAATAPAAAEPGENPCELALSFVCHFVPIAPDLDHDVDLTQQLSPDGPAIPPPDPLPPTNPCSAGCI